MNENTHDKKLLLGTHSEIPNLLLDKMTELGDIIQKHKARGGNPDSLKFYEGIWLTMRQAYTYMNDTRWIHRMNDELKSYNQFLLERLREVTTRLNEYVLVDNYVQTELMLM